MNEEHANDLWQAYLATRAEDEHRILNDERIVTSAPRVFLGSDFVSEQCYKHAQALLADIESGRLFSPLDKAEVEQSLQHCLASVSTEEALGVALRHFRYQQHLRLAWRDLAGWADIIASMRELSLLADIILEQTTRRLTSWLSQEMEQPRTATGEPIPFLIIAVGKLGGEELNFSSDIDLIFATTERADAPFFKRLAQRLLRVLNTVTPDGFVYRVDLRLRPYGDTGELVQSFSGLEAYYQEQGRDWERYALVKARVISDNVQASQDLQQLLKRFVYRRYVDYGAIDALRRLKQSIEREVAAKSLQDDIKRGEGGIRQIEFIAQVFQLIHGGQDKSLQDRSLLRVLEYLADCGTLPLQTTRELRAAYLFLRRVEHCLQMVAEVQTHTLPRETVALTRLSTSMGFAVAEDFLQTLQHHQHSVAKHFSQMVAEPSVADLPMTSDPILQNLQALWLGQVEEGPAAQLLTELGFIEVKEVLLWLQAFRDSHRIRQLSATARARLDAIFPKLLLLVSKQGLPIVTLRRLLSLFEAIVKRSAYLAMLLENPPQLKQFLTLFAVSAWVAEQVTVHPFLLDDLLHQDLLHRATQPEKMTHQLRYDLLVAPEQDLEQQMDILRRFKYRQMLQVACSDVMGVVPVEKASQQLTRIVETLLAQVYEIAYKETLLQYPDLAEHDLDFAIVAYGKLGAAELNYGSDLDLVFLYKQSSGASIPVVRLAQRILHLLSTRTVEGVLYSVDMRLRPSGESGLLVSDFASFSEYQSKEAWTWEHQALVRARMIHGSVPMRAQFAALRRQMLMKSRDIKTLKQEIVEMRQKVRQTHAVNTPGEFDLKHGIGGMVDIEFMVQLGVLAGSLSHPQLTESTNTLITLQQFKLLNVLSDEDCDALIKAWQHYRQLQHHALLQVTPTRVPLELVEEYPEIVKAIWVRLT
jgi:glutamate-ammonia-ligase adenylyltransferase